MLVILHFSALLVPPTTVAAALDDGALRPLPQWLCSIVTVYSTMNTCRPLAATNTKPCRHEAMRQ